MVQRHAGEMRAHHRQLEEACRGRRRAAPARRQRPPRRADGRRRRHGMRVAKLASAASLPRGPMQGDAGRPPVRRGRGRHGDGGKIEQVDEVRVGAELEFGPSGSSATSSQPRRARRRRYHQHVDAAPQRLGRALQLLQPIKAGERIGGGKALGPLDDPPRHRMHVFGAAFHEGADGGVALGHPRSLVEQRRGLEKRRHVHVDNLRAELLQHSTLARQAAFAAPSPKNLQVRGARHAETRMGRRRAELAERERRARTDRAASRPAITAIDRPGIVDGAGEHRDAVERCGRPAPRRVSRPRRPRA